VKHLSDEEIQKKYNINKDFIRCKIEKLMMIHPFSSLIYQCRKCGHRHILEDIAKLAGVDLVSQFVVNECTGFARQVTKNENILKAALSFTALADQVIWDSIRGNGVEP